jgi:hypothetical protein
VMTIGTIDSVVFDIFCELFANFCCSGRVINSAKGLLELVGVATQACDHH